MKIFSGHNVHKVLAVAIVGVLFGATYFANPALFKAPEAKAGTGENLSGFAWSENIEWISFNSTDCDTDGNGFIDSGACGGVDNSSIVTNNYGVSVGMSNRGTGGTGFFSGHAWSSDIGWISFVQSDITGICPSGATVAQVDWSTGKVTGWARALAGNTTSGWDGCIKFSDDSIPSWRDRGVAFSGNDLVGHAWGSDVIGWIDFAPRVDGNLITKRVKIAAPSVASVAASVTPTSVANGELFTLKMERPPNPYRT